MYNKIMEPNFSKCTTSFVFLISCFFCYFSWVRETLIFNIKNKDLAAEISERIDKMLYNAENNTKIQVLYTENQNQFFKLLWNTAIFFKFERQSAFLTVALKSKQRFKKWHS